MHDKIKRIKKIKNKKEVKEIGDSKWAVDLINGPDHIRR
jgi:hypothetical protein